MGAAITLMLAFRRQRHHELVEHVAAHDATERRVTELYTKAAEQLGHDKAAVRLAGLYALERLAQDNPGHRQTIVNVICAYLRMWGPPPSQESAPATPGPHPAAQNGVDQEGELQVRLTAQQILIDHLRDDRRNPHLRVTSPGEQFWDGMRIDLTGATLIDLDFTYCRTAEALFRRVTFTGQARFDWAVLTGDAWFDGTTFTEEAKFLSVNFGRDARFDGTTFTKGAEFVGATFSRDAWFSGATFAGAARFNGATFTRDTRFDGTTLDQGISFDRATVREAPDMKVTVSDWPAGWHLQPNGNGTWRLVR